MVRAIWWWCRRGGDASKMRASAPGSYSYLVALVLHLQGGDEVGCLVSCFTMQPVSSYSQLLRRSTWLLYEETNYHCLPAPTQLLYHLNLVVVKAIGNMDLSIECSNIAPGKVHGGF